MHADAGFNEKALPWIKEGIYVTALPERITIFPV